MELIGYFPRETGIPADWPGGSPNVTEVCSVSNCPNPAPEDWVEHWRHNELGFYNTPSDAWSIVPAQATGFRLFAYRLLPIRYLHERAEPFEIAESVVEPLTDGFVSLGFDVVNKTLTPFFECSPLSCNGMADEVPVNRFCLLPTLDKAISFAQRCAREEPEPGPFYVVEVLRDTT
jgi:hypothetical protein